jgi:deoxyribonuclease V
MTPREAIALQKSLRERVSLRPLDREIETVAGADISFNKYEPTLYAGIVVLRLPSLEVVEEVGVVSETRFPYVPGLLSFRESPPLLEAWSKLKTEPDAVMFDGQGIAHPRRVGIASHVGLIIERPTLGCAKSVLVGKYEEPPPERGTWTPLVDKGETIGAALRTKDRVNPIYVSPGHLIDLAGAIELTLKCNGGYRQPEPTRRAHFLVNALRRGEREPT